jgi:hypothetical protein
LGSRPRKIWIPACAGMTVAGAVELVTEAGLNGKEAKNRKGQPVTTQAGSPVDDEDGSQRRRGFQPLHTGRFA